MVINSFNKLLSDGVTLSCVNSVSKFSRNNVKNKEYIAGKYTHTYKIG